MPRAWPSCGPCAAEMTTSAHSTQSCEAVADLLAAEALDALEPKEQLALQRHLAACRSCSAELDAHRAAAASLAIPVPSVRPPDELRHQVLAAALRERPAT